MTSPMPKRRETIDLTGVKITKCPLPPELAREADRRKKINREADRLAKQRKKSRYLF